MSAYTQPPDFRVFLALGATHPLAIRPKLSNQHHRGSRWLISRGALLLSQSRDPGSCRYTRLGSVSLGNELAECGILHVGRVGRVGTQPGSSIPVTVYMAPLTVSLDDYRRSSYRTTSPLSFPQPPSCPAFASLVCHPNSVSSVYRRWTYGEV